MDTWHTVIAIAGLAVITLLTRGFFVLPEREIPIPRWLQQGLIQPLQALHNPGLVGIVAQLIRRALIARAIG